MVGKILLSKFSWKISFCWIKNKQIVKYRIFFVVWQGTSYLTAYPVRYPWLFVRSVKAAITRDEAFPLSKLVLGGASNRWILKFLPSVQVTKQRARVNAQDPSFFLHARAFPTEKTSRGERHRLISEIFWRMSVPDVSLSFALDCMFPCDSPILSHSMSSWLIPLSNTINSTYDDLLINNNNITIFTNVINKYEFLLFHYNFFNTILIIAAK